MQYLLQNQPHAEQSDEDNANNKNEINVPSGSSLKNNLSSSSLNLTTDIKSIINQYSPKIFSRSATTAKANAKQIVCYLCSSRIEIDVSSGFVLWKSKKSANEAVFRKCAACDNYVCFKCGNLTQPEHAVFNKVNKSFFFSIELKRL